MLLKAILCMFFNDRDGHCLAGSVLIGCIVCQDVVLPFYFDVLVAIVD